MKIRAYITHKVKEGFVDCQDRYSINPDTKSIAVSDGMSQSWQQKIWAKLLVSTFTNSKDWELNNDSVKPLCSQWREEVVKLIQQLKETGAPENIIYRNERNLAEGKSAGATFVGIRFDGNKWKGTVLGDSCLIEWNGKNATIYTSQDVDAFDSHPDYFDSDELKQGKGTPKIISGILDKGGYLFLVSDPFSDFLFEHKKQNDVAIYIQQLLKLSSHEEFENLVDDWRKAGMHNDDTTLVIVEPDDSVEFSLDANTLDDIYKLIDEEKKLIEEKKKEETAEQIPALVSNESTEGETENVSEKEDNQGSTSVKQMELPTVDEEVFLVDFLSEYKKTLQKKHSVLENLKFKWTQKAISETIKVMFEKYSINIK
jgi:serine/threonine protein phosphatase PrpC